MSETHLDLRKKLQDQANTIVNEAIVKTGIPISDTLEDFLKGVVMLSLKQGFKWGINANTAMNKYMLKDLEGDDLK